MEDTKKSKNKKPKTKWCPIDTCETCSGPLLRSKHKLEDGSKCGLHKHVCVSCFEKIAKGSPCSPTCNRHNEGKNKNRTSHRDYHYPTYCSRCNRLSYEWKQFCRNEQRKAKIKALKSTVFSLLELCCKAVAREPRALLFLSQQNLPEKTWELLEKHIPKTLSKSYKEDLIESQKDGGRAMYRCIGLSFCRFTKTGARQMVDFKEEEEKKKQEQNQKLEKSFSDSD